jgi:CDP-glycerol glycerophosphotransferase (TagB/SpsB family)
MPMQKEIGMIPKAVVRIQGQGDPFVWKTLAGISQFSCFFRHFVMPYYEFCKAHADSLNAKYNLLYYLKKLLVYAPKDEEEIKAIKESSDEIFTFIKEEELILENQYFDAVQKIYMLKNFNWDDHNSAVYREKKKAIMDGRSLENMLMFFHMGKKYVRLEGRTMMFGEEPFEIFIRCGKQLVPCKLEKKVVFRNWFHQDIARSEYYSCKIPHVPGQTLRMSVVCKKGSLEIEKRVMSFSTYTPFSGNVDLFERKDGWIADVDRSTGEILVFPDTGSNRAKVRIKRELSFLKGGKAAWKAIAARLMYKVFHTVKNKEIWLISDRINRADDNGECFFRYLSEHPQENVVPYFVIEKGCPEYKRMKAYGKVIPVYSWRHKMAHLLCDYIVSSQANKPVINPYGRISCFYKDLMYDKKFVFLQHGVTKDDQSAWLNRYSRNLYGFVVATKAEYQSIFDADYYYPEKNVWLTGMPRYDRLYRDEQKYITIMPTWRKSLSGGVTAKGEWTIGDTFAESNYFKFYNALLSHPRLLDAAQERGYQVCFMPHPNITPAIPLFDHDPRVNFWQADKSYRDVFAQSDLIVTDYSSVAFDFAYLRKPLVYAQFDREEFFSGSHSYTEGYYNYQTDGFGEIKENMEDLVDCLIEYMDNGCQLKEEYRERIERTFAFADQNCCARVLERMLEKHEK